MKKYFFMTPVLQWISQGKVFVKIFATIIRIIGGILLLFGLIQWFKLWKIIFHGDAELIIGGILFQALFVVGVYMIVHTLFIRANDMAQLQDDEFTIIPIIAILLKLMGEIYACFVIFISVAGGILMWFIGKYRVSWLFEDVPFLPSFLMKGGSSAFVGGLSFMILGAVFAFFVLVLFYLLSELIMVQVAIAKNTKNLR